MTSLRTHSAKDDTLSSIEVWGLTFREDSNRRSWSPQSSKAKAWAGVRTTGIWNNPCSRIAIVYNVTHYLAHDIPRNDFPLNVKPSPQLQIHVCLGLLSVVQCVLVTTGWGVRNCNRRVHSFLWRCGGFEDRTSQHNMTSLRNVYKAYEFQLLLACSHENFSHSQSYGTIGLQRWWSQNWTETGTTVEKSIFMSFVHSYLRSPSWLHPELILHFRWLL
jgi:hypothetical protein